MKTKEHPIIMTGESVRQILAGKKTQTRRAITHQGLPLDDFAFYEVDGNEVRTEIGRARRRYVGDRLWVKEAFCHPIPAGAGIGVGDDAEAWGCRGHWSSGRRF